MQPLGRRAASWSWCRGRGTSSMDALSGLHRLGELCMVCENGRRLQRPSEFESTARGEIGGASSVAPVGTLKKIPAPASHWPSITSYQASSWSKVTCAMGPQRYVTCCAFEQHPKHSRRRLGWCAVPRLTPTTTGSWLTSLHLKMSWSGMLRRANKYVTHPLYHTSCPCIVASNVARNWSPRRGHLHSEVPAERCISSRIRRWFHPSLERVFTVCPCNV